MQTNSVSTIYQESLSFFNDPITNSTQQQQQQKYQSSTLKSHNQYRINFLPWFPPSLLSMNTQNEEQKQEYPAFLLSSIPNQLLSTKQLQRRQSGACDRPFQYKILGNHPSFLNFIYRYLYQHLGERLHVDEAIIDYNLTRLDEAMVTIAMNNDQQQRCTEQRDIAFDVSQIAIALEIFLQTDVDMLYMKTCSYRGAEPRFIDTNYRTEGIFCIDPPETRYGLLPCTREHCRYCLENRHLTGRPEPTVVYYTSHYYTFLNGYQVILNCPATCLTTNIIYVLTCPCRQYEYIGTTKMAFSDRLWRHHQHGTRIMHEFLMGTTIINHTLTEPKSAEILTKDRMRLYRHSTLCGTAMQMFLNCNPHYWCCVPMKNIDANNDDSIYHQRPSTINIINGHQQHENTMENNQSFRTHDEIQWFMDNLPLPPQGYRFSQRQRNEQYLFFKNKQDLTMPSSHLDLYNATIIFVLPNNCSDFVRRFVESLLIIHTECNLNTAGQLAMIDRNNPGVLSNPLAHGLWYEEAFKSVNIRAQHLADRRGAIDKEYSLPNSFPECTPQLRATIDRWIRHHFYRLKHAKCLILIGPTGTGKTSFALSLPGQVNYFQGRWNLDNWSDYARYSVYDDIPWDEFKADGYPPKKAMLTQNGDVGVTDRYRKLVKIHVRQPAIVLMNPEDTGSLLIQSRSDTQEDSPDYWRKRATIYKRGPNEYFYKRQNRGQNSSSSASSMSINDNRLDGPDE